MISEEIKYENKFAINEGIDIEPVENKSKQLEV